MHGDFESSAFQQCIGLGWLYSFYDPPPDVSPGTGAIIAGSTGWKGHGKGWNGWKGDGTACKHGTQWSFRTVPIWSKCIQMYADFEWSRDLKTWHKSVDYLVSNKIVVRVILLLVAVAKKNIIPHLATIQPKRMCCPRPRGNIQRGAKKRAGVRILEIGEVDGSSCLGVGSLNWLPLKPETQKHKP